MANVKSFPLIPLLIKEAMRSLMPALKAWKWEFPLIPLLIKEAMLLGNDGEKGYGQCFH